MDTRTTSPVDALTEFNRQLLGKVMKPLTADGKAPEAPEVLQSLAAGMAENSQRWLVRRGGRGSEDDRLFLGHWKVADDNILYPYSRVCKYPSRRRRTG